MEVAREASDLEHLLNAIQVSLQQGAAFLVSRRAPNGPIMREPNLSYIHKTAWGMFASGVEHGIIAQLLDWSEETALQPNGDFYIPGEGAEYKDMQRVYRPLTFMKVAAWIGHPLAGRKQVIDRILQYQHASGGVFNYIGDSPSIIEEQPTIGTLNTTFFGHLMLALDIRERALKAGEWLLRLVELNEEHMLSEGIMYTNVTPRGELVTEVNPGERIAKVVDNREPKQEFWQVGTVMAYLAALYDVMRSKWEYAEDKAFPYLAAALALLDFEDTMPLETYLWPSKCKVGWGVGELLRVLIKYKLGTGEQIQKAYRIAEKVAVFTFMDNQLSDGGWSCMHYPLSELAPEIKFNYKPLKGIVTVPDRPVRGSQTIFLPREEITGEFLGEMKSIKVGIDRLLDQVKAGASTRGRTGPRLGGGRTGFTTVLVCESASSPRSPHHPSQGDVTRAISQYK